MLQINEPANVTDNRQTQKAPDLKPGVSRAAPKKCSRSGCPNPRSTKGSGYCQDCRSAYNRGWRRMEFFKYRDGTTPHERIEARKAEARDRTFRRELARRL